VLNLEN
jgi:hypothetical protein